MRLLVRTAVLLISLAVLFVVVVFGASEIGGEIVTLATSDESGSTVATRLWVVEHDGSQWLRAGVPTSGWLVRIEQNDAVTVTRDGETARYRAVPVRDPVVRDAIHRAMRRDYGWADRIVSVMRDPDLSVPVRLDPMDGGE